MKKLILMFVITLFISAINILQVNANTVKVNTNGDSKKENAIDRALIKQVDKNLNCKNSPTAQISQIIAYNHTAKKTKRSKDSRNKAARSYSYGKAVFSNPLKPTVKVSGYSKGYYTGKKKPSKIVLNQRSTISRNSISLSISNSTVGGSISHTNKSVTFKSYPLKKTKSASASYATFKASSYVAIYSVTCTDTADIYIGNNIYRPSSSIKLK